MKKQKNEKAQVGIFKNMGDNIPGRSFLGEIHQGGVWLVEISRVGVFQIPIKILHSSAIFQSNWIKFNKDQKTIFF